MAAAKKNVKSTKTVKTTARRTRKATPAKRVPNPKGNTGSVYTPAQLKKGAKLLAAGKLSQPAIAAACGVKSPANFTRRVRELSAA